MTTTVVYDPQGSGKPRLAAEKIVCHEIGRSTWQGPKSASPAQLLARANTQSSECAGAQPSAEQVRRLVRLIEECAELQQEASKIIRFGFDSYHPEDHHREPNRDRLRREMIDLFAAWDMLVGMGDVNRFGHKEVAEVHRRKANCIGEKG